jgi:hypothetical protein
LYRLVFIPLFSAAHLFVLAMTDRERRAELKAEAKRKRNGPTPGGIFVESSGKREEYIDRINACAFVAIDLKDKMLKEYFAFKSSVDALAAKLNDLEVLIQKFEIVEQRRNLEDIKEPYELSTDDEAVGLAS